LRNGVHEEKKRGKTGRTTQVVVLKRVESSILLKRGEGDWGGAPMKATTREMLLTGKKSPKSAGGIESFQNGPKQMPRGVTLNLRRQQHEQRVSGGASNQKKRRKRALMRRPGLKNLKSPIQRGVANEWVVPSEMNRKIRGKSKRQKKSTSDPGEMGVPEKKSTPNVTRKRPV